MVEGSGKKSLSTLWLIFSVIFWIFPTVLLLVVLSFFLLFPMISLMQLIKLIEDLLILLMGLPLNLF